MGTRTLAVSERLMEDILRAQLGTAVDGKEEGLPEEVRIVAARVNWDGVFEFKLISDNYEGPQEGQRVPWLGGRFLT